jgi:PEGA domain
MRTLKTIILALALMIVPVGSARAGNNNDAQSRDAAKHFQRGVDLYNEGDFRGALVEFKKAYQIWPRANVLYDIGQTEYQLLDYASALKTMERYLAETGANAPHRQEVEASVEVLRGRVGRVVLTSDPSCDVTIDDQPAGTTPLDAPLLVSVGPHRLGVACAGPRSTEKRIEVAGGETLKVELRPAASPINAVKMAMNGTPHADKPANPGKAFVTGWIVTGVLVAGTVALGTTTLVEQSKLNSMRAAYPANPNDVSKQQALTTGLAITSDVLGVGSLVAAGVSTYLTIKYEKTKRLHVGLTAQSVSVGGTF